MASWPEMDGGPGRNRHLDLPALNRQRMPLLATHFQAEQNRLFDILKGSLLSFPLTHATGDDGARDNVPIIFILIKSDREFPAFRVTPELGW